MTSPRWKLVLTTMLVVFIPVYFLNRHAISYFDHFTRTALERSMNETMWLIEDLLLAEAETSGADALPETFPARLRFIDPENKAFLPTQKSALMAS